MSLFKGNAFVRHLLITIILSCVSSDSFAGTCGATRPTGSIRSTVVSENASVMLAKSSLGGRNLFFIENRGQLKDQSGNPRGDIDFKMSGGKGLNVFVGRGGLHYQWSASLGDRTYKSRLCRMDVELTGANKNAQLHVEDIQDYCERYYTSSSGSDSVVLAHSYKKISYRNIYKDIDWVLYVKDGKLEYDFIVHPGGNVKDIQFRYKGSDHIALSRGGDLSVSSLMGSVQEQRPIGYEQENGSAVKAGFVVRGNSVCFDVAKYDGTLVIDPMLDWSTYCGGLGDESALAVVCDGQANVYICGQTSSISNIITTGAYQTLFGGLYDAFVVQLNSLGQRQWATYFGGGGAEKAEAISYNGTGDVYVTGYTTSNSGIASASVYQGSYGGGSNDAFLVKFNTAGARIWSTYFGGSGGDMGQAIVCSGGNVYISGQTSSSANIATGGSYKDSLSGAVDAFISAFNSSGSLQWATYYGGNDQEFPDAMTADLSGNIYISGVTYSANGIATSGAYQDSLKGIGDAFLAKFNNSGMLQWGTYYGGSGTEEAHGLAMDNSGKIYMCGETGSSNYVATTGSFQPAYSGSGDAFLVQFDLSGARQWATYYGGISQDVASAVTCNGNGKVYLSGFTNSTTSITTSGSYQTVYGGGALDAYLVEFDTTGSRLWATYFGGSGQDDNNAAAIDAAGNVYIAGSTASSAGIASTNGYQGTFGGGNIDAYLAKFKIDTLVSVSQPFIDTLFCAGDTFHLFYSTIDTFQTANVFTAQLSDSSGSFVNAINIGSANGGYSGSMLCMIPLSAISGTHYRIRIYGNHPVDTSAAEDINIVIKGSPGYSVGYNTPLCKGDTLKLYDSANAVSHHWVSPNNTTSSVQFPSIPNINYSDSGYYFITDSFSNGCKVKDSVFVHVGFVPFRPFASSNSPVCAGDSLKLGSIDNTSGVSYYWSGPVSYTAFVQNPVIAAATTANSGKYVVKVLLNNCFSLPDTINVLVNPTLVPTVSINSTSPIVATQTDTFHTVVTNGGGLPSYQWYLNGTAIAGATNSSYVTSLNNTDLLCVLIHSNALCVNPDTAESCTFVGVSVKNVSQVSAIKIYPNPVGNQLYIHAPEKVRIVIADLEGKILLNQGDMGPIDVSFLRPGVYIAKIYDEKGNLLKNEKLIKLP